MKTVKISVGSDLKVKVHIPESLNEVRQFVSDEQDLLYLANRGLDQVRRTHLLSIRKSGATKKEVQARAYEYQYHRQTRYRPIHG